MCKVTRYKPMADREYGHSTMAPDNNGAYILYRDYEKLVELVAISLMNIRDEESEYIVNVIDDLNEKIGKLI